MPSLYVGIGINSGDVFTGPIGSSLHGEYTMIGSEVHLTSHIEAQSLRNKTVLPAMHCGQVVDMGYHGLCMISPVPLELHGEIKMAISLQTLGMRTSDVYARLLSADTDTEGYCCSMKFADIDMAGQQSIKQFGDSQIYA